MTVQYNNKKIMFSDWRPLASNQSCLMFSGSKSVIVTAILNHFAVAEQYSTTQQVCHIVKSIVICHTYCTIAVTTCCTCTCCTCCMRLMSVIACGWCSSVLRLIPLMASSCSLICSSCRRCSSRSLCSSRCSRILCSCRCSSS